MKYKSIVPSEMTQDELRAIISDLQIHKNWGCKTATVQLENGFEYVVDVKDIGDYREFIRIDTGNINI